MAPSIWAVQARRRSQASDGVFGDGAAWARPAGGRPSFRQSNVDSKDLEPTAVIGAAAFSALWAFGA